MTPECPFVEFDAFDWHEAGRKYTGRYWFILLRGSSLSTRGQARITRYIDSDWELFEKGDFADMQLLFDGLPDGSLPPPIEIDLDGDTVTQIPSDYAGLPNFARF